MGCSVWDTLSEWGNTESVWNFHFCGLLGINSGILNAGSEGKVISKQELIQGIFMWLKHDNNYKDLYETLLHVSCMSFYVYVCVVGFEANEKSLTFLISTLRFCSSNNCRRFIAHSSHAECAFVSEPFCSAFWVFLHAKNSNMHMCLCVYVKWNNWTLSISY